MHRRTLFWAHAWRPWRRNRDTDNGVGKKQEIPSMERGICPIATHYSLTIVFILFLLLALYVPNVAKRSIWDQCRRSIRTDRPTDRRPTTDLTFGKISNGHISARGRPIHFMFGSTVGFSLSADRTALIPVWPNSLGTWEKTIRKE